MNPLYKKDEIKGIRATEDRFEKSVTYFRKIFFETCEGAPVTKKLDSSVPEVKKARSLGELYLKERTEWDGSDVDAGYWPEGGARMGKGIATFSTLA